MIRRNFYIITLACAALVTVLVLLSSILHIVSWAGIAWPIVIVLALVVVGFMAYLGYAIVSIEMGYNTDEEISRRMRNQSSHALHPIKALLHLRTLRHH
jgi:hypothetical protein